MAAFRLAEVRWGIIGCGNVTEKKSGPAFNKVPGSRLVAVMRRQGELARDYARRHGVPRAYDQAEALIADPEVNAIYIATPPGSHRDYALASAAAGKAVYVEKPMARCHAECQAMVTACERAGVPLFVAYYRRQLPSHQRVRELVTSGAIGTVHSVQVRLVQTLPTNWQPNALPWRVQPALSGGGIYFDLASHQLDYLDYLLGPMTQISGRASNRAGLYPAEDNVVGTWEHESGVLGTGSWCFTAGPGLGEEHVTLVGSAGRLRYDNFAFRPIVLENAAGKQEIPCEVPEHVQLPLIASMVAELRGTGTCPSTGVSAARTAAVMDQMVANYRAAHGQGW